MGDFPLVLLTATIWTYWFTVGAMVVRIRRTTRKLVGVVPRQRIEQIMWLVWVPLVLCWMALPWLALSRTRAPLAVPEFARQAPYPALRWVAALVAIACLLLTVRCWKRMGKDWRMDTAVGERTALITDGLFERIRHPIYAFSMLLMTCSAVILPTLPMLAIAIVHFVLMNLKARNEERYLLLTHGDAYRSYVRTTGRFFPRIGGTSG
jgi:protein-S-isoprenylcysteine O-methyltransferase Ste14